MRRTPERERRWFCADCSVRCAGGVAERIASGELTATEDPAEEKVVDVLEAGRPADNTRTRLPPLAHTISGLERSPPACRCWRVSGFTVP